MGDPVLVLGFMAGTILYPDPQTHRTMIQHLLGNNTEPVVEDGFSEHEERIGSLGLFLRPVVRIASGRTVAGFLERFLATETNFSLFVDLQDFHQDLVPLFQDVTHPAILLGCNRGDMDEPAGTRQRFTERTQSATTP